MKKILIVATVVKQHIMPFHIPHLRMLKENGYEVHVAARNDYENSENCNIPFCDKFYNLPFERFPIKKNNTIVYKKLKKIVNQTNYDIIHCHTPVGGVIGRLASIQARKKGTKVIYTAHGFHFYKGAPLLNWLVYYPTEKILSMHTDVLITINKEDYNMAKRLKANKIEFIHGVGINTEKFNGKNINSKEKRKNIGVSSNEFMIISVGELNHNKNHQSIIKAISDMKDDKIKYIICGQGPLEMKLKKLAKQLNISNQIIFLGFRDDINELMSVADLYAFPSFREGLSLSLMEAMASSLPVVCSDIRGNNDLIKNGQGGYLFPPRDLKKIINSIRMISSSTSNRRKEFGKSNFKKINIYFSEEKVLKRMDRVYKNV